MSAEQPPRLGEAVAAEIPLQPLPTQVTMTRVTADLPNGRHQTMLLVQVSNPAGTTAFFADHAFATQLLANLRQHLQAWPAELVVPAVDLEQVRAALGQAGGNGAQRS